MLTTAQVVETSVIVSNSPSEYYIQLYTHLDWHSLCSVLQLQITIVTLLSVRAVQLKPDVSHFFLKWSFEEKVYLDDSFVRGWRGLFEYFDMSWFFLSWVLKWI